jgi:neutral trehalase
MKAEQVTLLTHATEELRKAKTLLMTQNTQRQPLPLETAIVAKKLGISPSTLNRAKRQGKLPYEGHWNNKIVVVEFSHTEKGSDYWTVSIQHTD